MGIVGVGGAQASMASTVSPIRATVSSSVVSALAVRASLLRHSET
jgi:hypothetical protein